MPWGGNPSFSAVGAKGGGRLPTHPTSSGKILLPGGTDQLQTRNAGIGVAGPALERLGELPEAMGLPASPDPEAFCQATLTETPSKLRGQDSLPSL